MHGAGPALRDAAPELRAGEAEVVAQHPQERRVGRDVHGLAFAVDGEDDRGHDALRAEGVEEAGVGTGKGEGGRGKGWATLQIVYDPAITGLRSAPSGPGSPPAHAP